jgi:hypothetical protein
MRNEMQIISGVSSPLASGELQIGERKSGVEIEETYVGYLFHCQRLREPANSVI